MTNNKFEIIVNDEKAGLRLDQFLADCPELRLSRNRAQKHIEMGKVRVNGELSNKKKAVVTGDKVKIEIIAVPRAEIKPEKIDLDIVYNDEHLAVINKPAGLVTHPGAGNFTGTLVNALVYNFKTLAKTSDDDRPGIVHRLDKATSGLLIVAKTDEVGAALMSDLAERKIKRVYLGLIWGHVTEDSGTINLPIARSNRDRKKMAITSTGGREAVTNYELLERYRSFDLLKVSLETGRTHQIRVHLSHLGHPIFGDPEYGGRDKSLRGLFAPERPLAKSMLELINRQALLAFQLNFTHPVTGEELTFEVKPPMDFQAVLDLLKEHGS